MKMPIVYSPYGFFRGGVEYLSLHFNGEVWDGWSEGYHLGKGKRFYRPKLMRFTSPDNLSPFLAGGVNAYAYCKGDPVNFTDPSGKVPTLKLLAQKALKKQGVISKRSQTVFGTIRLDEWAPSPRSSALDKEYHRKLLAGMSGDEIASSYPGLKAYYKSDSRQTALAWIFEGERLGRPMLSRHQAIADRLRPIILDVKNKIYLNQPMSVSGRFVPPRRSIVKEAVRYGCLNPMDENKLLRWIAKEDKGFSSDSSDLSDLSDF